MKNQIYMVFICAFIFFVNSYSYADEIYDRTFRCGSSQTLAFRSVSYDRLLISEFPVESLAAHPLVESFAQAPIPGMGKAYNHLDIQMSDSETIVTLKFTLCYAIHQSIMNAEDDAMDRVISSPLVHTFDFDGRVGDNCWFFEGWGQLIFIRNNIVVALSTMQPVATDDLLTVASVIDTLLIESPHTNDSSDLPFPTIQNVTYGHEISVENEDEVYQRPVIVYASDPLGRELWYAELEGVHWSTATDTRNTLNVYYSSEYSKRKFWVVNDSFYVTSFVVDF